MRHQQFDELVYRYAICCFIVEVRLVDAIVRANVKPMDPIVVRAFLGGAIEYDSRARVSRGEDETPGSVR